MPVARAHGARAGVALPSAVFALVAISVVAVGAYAMVDLNRLSAENRQDAARALQLAEAGASHAVALLTGDLAAVKFTTLLSGDSLLAGHGLEAADEIPATGRSLTGGNYYVKLYDDPGGSSRKILARCRGVTDDGAEATVDLIVYATALPAIATNGSLQLQGSVNVVGECGAAHANGNVTLTGSALVVAEFISASGTVGGNGSATDPDGNAIVPESGADSIKIPTITAASLCADSAKIDYYLNSSGMAYIRLTGLTVAPAALGWSYNSGTATWSQATGQGAINPLSGTYCVTGNVNLSSNISATISLISTGSVAVTGNTTLTSDHTDGYLIVADGDFDLGGNSQSSASGILYAGAQCSLSGSGGITGQVMCADNANPAGATNLTSSNQVSGSGTITYDCGGAIEGERVISSWYQIIE